MQTLECYLGTDWEFRYQVVDGNSTPVEIRTSTSTALLKRSPDDADADALAELTVTTAADGWATLTLPRAATQDLPVATLHVGHRMRVEDWEDIVTEFEVRIKRPIVMAL